MYLEYDSKASNREYFIFATETTKSLYDYLRQLIFAVGEYWEYQDGLIEYWIEDTEEYGVELYIEGRFIMEMWVNSKADFEIIYFTHMQGLMEGEIYEDGNIHYFRI